jgi:uncharacterized protein (TIGR00375 family)
MEFIADLHIHSHLSRATAKNLNLEHLNLWAQLKGITVVGTGDFTHPQWFSELSEKLEPAEDGLFSLKPDHAAETAHLVPAGCRGPVRFILGVEISSIYKKDGKTRKVHNVVMIPTLEAAEQINRRLERIGNIASDGRPILGLDSKTLLEIILETSEDAVLIPAHIWTPWFSVLGSKSGFDSIEECFEELTPHIFAAETGLSADPAMCWRISSLDELTLVSNSDAHSPANLGREANLFDTDLSYFAIRDALKTSDPERFLGTLEYFAEEGKYHFDGHRKCGVRFSPLETVQNEGLCPVCGKLVTIGVMYRVEELADRKAGEKPKGTHPYTSLLPLTDVLSEVLQVGPKSKKVTSIYRVLLERLGAEFEILRNSPLDALERHGPALLAEAIKRMRNNDVHIAPGYDGEFGTVSLFTEEERQCLLGQKRLFRMSSGDREDVQAQSVQPSLFQEDKSRVLQNKASFINADYGPALDHCRSHKGPLDNLNAAQQEAVQYSGGPLLIVAGPGTGKTRTLTHRIGYLISKGTARPEQVLAVTFTNKAAAEMSDRLATIVNNPNALKLVTVKTFHALCLDIMTSEADALGVRGPIRILNEKDRRELVKVAVQRAGANLDVLKGDGNKILSLVSLAKQLLLSPGDDLSRCVHQALSDQVGSLYNVYQQLLDRNQVIDFDDLIFKTVRLFEANQEIRRQYEQRFSFVSIDEYQDINYAQYRLVRLLAPDGHNICVIGDPDQAIYGFRGADVRYFHKFCKDYPGTKTVRLKQNYRSTEAILQASEQVVASDRAKGQKEIWSGIYGARALTVAELPTERGEAEYIVKAIEEEVGGISHFSIDSGRIDAACAQEERSFSDFTVLYRIKDQARSLKEAFARSGIPFQNVGDEKLENRKGIRELISYLKVGVSLSSDFDVERIVNFPGRSISRTTVKALKKWSEMNGTCLLTALERAAEVSGLTPPAKRKLMAFSEDLKKFKKCITGRDVREQIQLAADHFNIMGEMSGNKAFEEDLRTLMAISRLFGDSDSRFLAHLALEKEQDLYDPRAEKVTLMTMHASKGLEFPVVFIAGCEDGLIPFRAKRGDEGDIAEEARLFYVALTRAQDRVFLTHAKSRERFGKRTVQCISPFLETIEEDLKQYKRPFEARPTSKKAAHQLRLF